MPGGIRNNNPNMRAAVDLCLRPRGHWNRRWFLFLLLNVLSPSELPFSREETMLRAKWDVHQRKRALICHNYLLCISPLISLYCRAHNAKGLKQHFLLFHCAEKWYTFKSQILIMYIYIHTYTYTHTYTYMHTHIHIYTYTYIHTHIHMSLLKVAII
jgi:hypothetical protein